MFELKVTIDTDITHLLRVSMIMFAKPTQRVKPQEKHDRIITKQPTHLPHLWLAEGGGVAADFLQLPTWYLMILWLSLANNISVDLMYSQDCVKQQHIVN